MGPLPHMDKPGTLNVHQLLWLQFTIELVYTAYFFSLWPVRFWQYTISMMPSILILFWIGYGSAKILPLELAKALYIRNAVSQVFPLSVSAYEELLYC